MATATREFYARAQQRIGWLTLVLGLAAAAITGVAASLPAGAGVAAGAILAWVNYRWLEGGVNAVAAAATQAGEARPRVPLAALARFTGRYFLIALCVYVIVAYFAVPLLSVLAGLLSLGAAAMAEGLYEVLFPNR